MKLSFIIISYNEAEYLGQAIESCLKQNLEDFEIIIGDDGSNDGSIEILEQYKEKYPEIIRYFVSDRTGVVLKDVIASLRVSNVITEALKIASGEYCVILSGDDYFYETPFFEKAISFLDNNKKYVTYIGGFEKVWVDKPAVSYNTAYPPQIYWGSGKYIHISAFVFKKNVFEKGMFLKRFCDDIGIAYSLGFAGKWKYDKEIVFAYRQRSGSIMQTADQMNFRIVELMILQDTLCKGYLYNQTLAHFSKSLKYVFKHRDLLDSDKYKKYFLNCEKYDQNIIKKIYNYNHLNVFEKFKFKIWLTYAEILGKLYHLLGRIVYKLDR